MHREATVEAFINWLDGSLYQKLYKVLFSTVSELFDKSLISLRVIFHHCLSLMPEKNNFKQ